MRKPQRRFLVHSRITTVLPRLHAIATGATAVPLLQQLIGPGPDQGCRCLHPNVLHHAEINGLEVVQPLPFRQQWIVDIDQKGVIELLPQALFEGAKAGEINNKPAGIQLRCGEPEIETAAVPMHEAAMALVAPLPVTAGIAAEAFAAAVGGRRNEQGVKTRNGARCGKIQALPKCPRPDAAPQPRLHRPTPF